MSDNTVGTPIKEDENVKTNDKPWYFKIGNPGGPGRPKNNALVKEIYGQAAPYVAQVIVEEAMRGDIRAGAMVIDKILPTLTKGEQDITLHDNLAEALKITVRNDGNTNTAGGR